MSYRQFDLSSGDTRMRTWLEDDERLRVGTRLTLRGDDRVWTIESWFGVTLEDPPHKDWKVGGLV